MKTFSELRQELSLTEVEVSDLLGIPLQRVAAYERGKERPSAREIQAIKGLSLSMRDPTQTLKRCAEDAGNGMAAPKEDSHQHIAARSLTERSSRLPHPIPYQGSKRALAPFIAPYIPIDIDKWFEPFAGSAAMTLWVAHNGAAKRYIIGESLEPIARLWRAIIDDPASTAARYREIWNGQRKNDFEYFNKIRDRYNSEKDPVDLLYLVCRCVKNAVRFNRHGAFTQSVDKRRLGMRPEKMSAAITGASQLLSGRTEVRVGDWLDTTGDATCRDFLYMDPPYLGTSIGRDKRYAHQMGWERLTAGLEALRARSIRFALSYDGMTGTKEYGPPLPEELGLTRLLLRAGVSSQSTLNGRNEETIESLYLSPGLAKLRHRHAYRTTLSIQESLEL